MGDQVVQVGIAVILLNENGEVLLGKRINTINSGVYALPGGKPDFGEDLEVAGKREVEEETGIKITGQMIPCGWKDNPFVAEGKHFVTLFYIAAHMSFQGEPQNLEPHKCEYWKWYPLNKLPEPLWQGLDKFLNVGKIAKTIIDTINF